MRQAGRAWGLAAVDAGGPPDYAVEATLKVPNGAEPGRAVVVADAEDGKPPKVPFGVLGGGPPSRAAEGL